MKIYKIYPDFLDIGWIGNTGYNRNLIARYSSLHEHHANGTTQPPSPQWEKWGKELAKL